MTGAAFSYFWHGRIANPIGTDAQGGACRFRGRGSLFARSGTDFVAGASLSQGQVQNSWQVQHFARSIAKFVAGASLSQGQVHISWRAQHFRKVKYRFRGRRSTFARSTFFCSRGSKIATFKCESRKRSQLSQLGLENRNF